MGVSVEYLWLGRFASEQPQSHMINFNFVHNLYFIVHIKQMYSMLRDTSLLAESCAVVGSEPASAELFQFGLPRLLGAQVLHRGNSSLDCVD